MSVPITTRAAPIQRYSDPRLYGTTLVKPFGKSYEWIRTVAHPMHPQCSVIEECAFRAMKILTGVVALAITMLPALIGRTIQVIHYYTIPTENRLHPTAIEVDGICLPAGLQACQELPRIQYHGTNKEGAIGILRWGFDPSKTGLGAKMGNAAYVSTEKAVSATYGKDQLIVTLDLRDGEFAYLSDNALKNIDKCFSDKKVMASVQKLFYLNGFRAIKYDLDHYGPEEAWAVYDASCISITELRPSLTPAPPNTQGILLTN
jgi:hypothetical protein